MKLTLSWLKEFIDLPVSDASELVDVFESLGHEIEDWHPIEPTFTDVVVGKVLEVSVHPNAEKVRLTKVDVGTEVLEIICGAWNFDVGAIVPVAVPGAVLSGDFVITKREIRGITSNGMICSESELELGEETDGIMVLNADYPEAAEQIGSPLAAVVGFPDTSFEINVTPNRPDCLSVYGLARDLAAFYEIPLRNYDIEVEEGGNEADFDVTISAPEQCPRFTGRQVRGITVGPSPHWLRWRLIQAGLRPISNVVDASNYAMIEFGHPTHAFDVASLGRTIDIRLAVDGELITTLDDQERCLTSNDVVVASGSAPVAVGGVMGGAATEVHGDTTDVFIEAAYWRPASILLTSKRLGLRSEASGRFERGADPSFTRLAADRVAQLLERIAGGIPAPGVVDINPGSIDPWVVRYPLSETRRVLGIDLDRDTTAGLLERLEFSVTQDDPLFVTIPTRRPDVRKPVDLVEEIARLHGFAGIPDTVPSGPGGGLPYRERRMRRIRETLVGSGLNEILTFSFISAEDISMLDPGASSITDAAIRVVNPLNETEGVMRTSLIPGLLKAAGVNLSRSLPSAAFFEIGKVFLRGEAELPDQPDRLGVVLAGAIESTWYDREQATDVYDGTGIITLLLTTLDVPEVSIVRSVRPSFHPGRCADIVVRGSVIGTVGEILPRVVESFGLSGRVVIAEIDLAELLTEKAPWTFAAPSIFPPVIFDLAFAAPSDVPARAVIDAASAAAGDLLENISLFDVFEGESIGEGAVSYALNFRLRASDRTMTDAEAGPIRQAIADKVARDTGATLRGEL